MDEFDKILKESGFEKEELISQMDSIPFKSNKDKILSNIYKQNDKYKETILYIIIITISICIYDGLKNVNIDNLALVYGFLRTIDLTPIYTTILVLLYTALISFMFLFIKEESGQNS